MHRLSIVVVVACSGPAAPQPAPPTTTTPTTTTPTSPAVAAPASATTPATATTPACGRDEVRESLCGGMALPGGVGDCGPNAQSLASAGVQRMVITSLTRGFKSDPMLATFELD